ncbi:MAG: hypothetical protein AAFY26_17515 [Cyanobacteria bacterium J06638_22]
MVALTHKSDKKRPYIWLFTLLSRFEKPLVALFITLGLMLAAIAQSHAHTVDSALESRQVAVAPQAPLISQQVENGVYLYGQSEQPFELGSEYLVFEVMDDQVFGGFYMPNSSFDCFYGDVQSGQLNLNIVSAYDQEVYPYAIALASNDAIAGDEPQATPMQLVGFHRLDTLSDLDQQILNTCRTDMVQS